MNFVRAETLVQEITADGKVRDIVTQVKKTEAERVAEQKEDIIRNLPEFKRDRGEGGSAGERITAEEKAAEAAEAEEKAKEEKKYRVCTIDEDDFEHYQGLEDAERERKRKQASEDSEAKAAFNSERERLLDKTEERADLLSAMRQQNIEKAEKRNKATLSAADRLKGRITVKARSGVGAAEPPQKAQKVQPASGQSLGLGGYASDSDDDE
eukprot:TRINITY_DN41237_c0_g1_i1.p1 TRINITY_DN41237_c0_g1~~TRINITY_DN41237_c0_g1_i1.p1  ORF type:complete len:211 (-),score=78.97 TRINITY_DN41237_c0_g1_i1:41-673(-)